MRLYPILPLCGDLSAAAVAAIAAATFSARAIEQTSQHAVSTQLELEGFEWTDVATDGLQVILMGSAPNEANQLAAQRAAGHVVDAARVINVMTIDQRDEIPAPHFSIEILRNDQGISLIGLVPTNWDREAFIQSLKKTGGTGSVTDLLEQANYTLPENWDNAMEFGVDAIKRLPRSKISLSATKIDVTALADSPQQKATLERILTTSAPDDVQFLLNITAPRPVITPFTARFLIDDNGPHFDACTAETTQGHARIIAAAQALDVVDPECVVGLGAPSRTWASAVETGMRALNKINGGSITFSDFDVAVVGPEGLSQKDFDRAIGDLEADLPDSFSLHATWTPPADVDAEEEQAEFVILRSPEGQVQLRGRIGDERGRLAAEALASAAFSSQTLYSAMRIDDTLPNGWSTRVFTAVEVLKGLAQGSVTVHDNLISVRGQTGDATAKANITRLLAAHLGDGQTYDINVKYVRKLDPILNIPSPEKCLKDANTAISNGKIVFKPGSTDVDTSADDTLDRIAKALEVCEDISMEIGGHTDSQGREEMNQQLSQARANSVLDALLTRRVLGVDFSSKGYGESIPIADNATADGREENRRIEFKLTDGADASLIEDAIETTPDEAQNE